MESAAERSARLDPNAMPEIVEFARFAFDTQEEQAMELNERPPERVRDVPCASAKNRSWNVDEAVVEVAEIYPTFNEPMEDDAITARFETKRVEVVASVEVDREEEMPRMVEDAELIIMPTVVVGVMES